MKRFIALLLAFVLMFSGFAGFGTKEAKAAGLEHVEAYHVNPRYADVFDKTIESIVPTHVVLSMNEADYSSDINVVGKKIQEAMIKRESTVTVYYKTDILLDDTYLNPMMEAAFVDLSNPKGGDYLAWHYGGSSARGSGFIDSEGNYCYTITISILYYTTAEQEAELEVEADKVLKEIGVSSSLSDYENLKKIYDYMCENIVYDYDNLYDDSYKLKYTAYAALVNKTSVCQGYANLFYYLARKSGLDARIVTGIGNGGPHGWNIAEIDGWYYNLDATWDAGRNRYSYFLVGSNNFTDHAVDEEMYDDNYWKLHPLSKVNYEVANPQTPPSKVYDLSKAKLMTIDGKEYVLRNLVYDEFAKVQQGFVVCDENGDVIDSSNYNISYTNNVNPGTAKLTIAAKGSNCVGSLSKSFEILRASVDSLTVRLSETYYTYDGTAKFPQVIVKTATGRNLVKDRDYYVEYLSNGKTIGSHVVHVEVNCEYQGSKDLAYEIWAKEGWVKDSVGWRYQLKDGSYLENTWKEVDGKKYYFESDSYMVTGWKMLNGKWYYLNPTSGAMVTGMQTIGNDIYYLDENGVMQTGWVTVGGSQYYFTSSGALTKVEKIEVAKMPNKTKYLLGEDISLVGMVIKVTYKDKTTKEITTGFKIIRTENGSGNEMRRIVIEYEGNSTSLEVKIHQGIDGWKYNDSHHWHECTGCGDVIDKSAHEYTNGTDAECNVCFAKREIKDRWVKDKVGYWYQRADGTYPRNGWAKIGDDWYYFNASGYRVTGWINDGGVWYYLMEKGNRPETEGMENPDEGKMVHGAWFADKDGKTYYFQESGAMTTGWMCYRGEWYYFNNSGAVQKGWQLIGGTWYYFNEIGTMMTGWQSLGGTWYYFNGGGAMVVGWQSIGGAWYYFQASGAMVANRWIGNYFLQADGSMAVNKRIGIYYVGADGAWIPGR